MARPFSYPEVQQLEVGQSCEVEGSLPEVRQKIKSYGSRNNKSFNAEHMFADGWLDESGLNRVTFTCRVTRLPDPEPEVA